MASPVICLANNQKFNFSKYIFDNMVKSLEGRIKFYLFLRFLQVFLDNQLKGMSKDKEMYVFSSHAKKIFANMRRIRAGFFGVVTPLFDTMMVQAIIDMGDTPRKEAEVSPDESEDKDHVPTPSSDPLLSGRRVKSPLEKDSLGAQGDASKQGRMIKEIDQNDKIALDANTRGRKTDDEMFRVDDLTREEVVTNVANKVSTDPTIDVTEDEITMAQALAPLKSVKPTTGIKADTQGRKTDDEMFGVDDLTGEEVVTTVAGKVSDASTTNVTEDEVTMAQALAALKSVRPIIPAAATKVTTKVPTLRAIEPKVPIKKKDQMRMAEEYTIQLEVKEQEATRLSRAQQDEEANISWDNTQAMMEADNLFAKRLQAREREDFSEV
nr:hypothetical protein [Tanacetum cinerariifolium]